MSYDYRDPGVAYGAPEGGRAISDGQESRKGSVRAARERLQAAQRAQMQGIIATNQARLGLPARPNQLASQFSLPRQGIEDIPTPPSSNGSMTTRNMASPQWPLRNDDDEVGVDVDFFADDPADDEDMSPTATAVQNPARAGYASNEGNLQPPQNQFSAARSASQLRSPRDAWQDEDGFLSPTYASPNPSRPITTSSQASTVSSLGSIPDFPIPNTQVSRRSPNMGPPPSSRRGPSSYYSHMSYVSPIVEESEGTRSHNSFASSNVIPDVGGFYFDEEDVSPSDEEELIRNEVLSDGFVSPRSDDQDDQKNLVRQASLGRRQKPQLTTIKSGENVRNGERPVSDQPDLPEGSNAMHNRQLGSITVLLDPSSSSESESSSTRRHQPAAAGLTSPMPRSPNVRSPGLPKSPRPIDRRLSAAEKEMGPAYGSGSSSNLVKPSTVGSLAQRVGTRRPPRINVDAVREAEARGSLTSLPDLIRRATRLAANLDRGRTASKLGLQFYEDAGLEKTEKGGYDNRKSGGSLQDMLASFPPPGIATPDAPRAGSPAISQWPSGRGMAGTPSQKGSEKQNPPKSGRRCCGMPFWGFITLITILFLLIAAAVIIPIVLIVLPKQNSNQSGATSGAQNVQCSNSLTCQNGGVLIPSADGSCRCLCTNGFTGATCITASDAGCTTTQISNIQNATLGSGIPRLLQLSSTFNVPLDASSVLAEFSAENLSCTAENALVTFNGLASRQVHEANVPMYDEQLLPSITTPRVQITEAPMLPRDADQKTVFTVSLITMTSNGIVIEASPSSTAISTPTGTAASASPSSSSSSTPLTSNSTVLDFARVGVLFVLQTARKLDTAVTAQERLQTFLESSVVIKGSSAQNLTLGNGFFIDLTDLRLSLPNGTFVGLGTQATSTSS